MKKREKTLTEREKDELMIADANDPLAWGDPVLVPRATAPRPKWVRDGRSDRSGTIARIGYDPSTRILHIQFRNGRIYQYFGVPAETYEHLRTATGIDTYFESAIRTQYRCAPIVWDTQVAS
ncbi:MAG TPA: KTSC domain-containing protein [Thermoanaerobaculia bacterium]|nr:KTSC domain-containing protein [Thermoanaerobaculia bacterium]